MTGRLPSLGRKQCRSGKRSTTTPGSASPHALFRVRPPPMRSKTRLMNFAGGAGASHSMPEQPDVCGDEAHRGVVAAKRHDVDAQHGIER